MAPVGHETKAPLLRRPEFVYSAALFAAAALALTASAWLLPARFTSAPPTAVLFFFGYALLTISTGYRHPKVGYVSFDRVSQVAAILVLGPFTAAWVNGLASMLFPWRRLRRGGQWRQMLTASLNNSGLMTLMVLSCGMLYLALGGIVPLERLDWGAAYLLALLILSMQVVNQIGLGIHFRLRDGRRVAYFSRFVITLETTSGMTAVVVAIVLNRMELPVIALMLIVSSLGMLVLTEFARMRVELEAIVEERTRVLREKTIELAHLATRDQLTGLSNRRHADEFLERYIEEYHRYHRGFAIALIDLDHFKRINDRHSHEVGDEVLKRVSRIFRDRCRDTDLVSRYGGEEFLLCFPEATIDSALRICEQLRESVEGADWKELGDDLRVSLSAGVAEMGPGLDRSSLVTAADEKLYEAKNAGRNVVVA